MLSDIAALWARCRAGHRLIASSNPTLNRFWQRSSGPGVALECLSCLMAVSINLNANFYFLMPLRQAVGMLHIFLLLPFLRMDTM